MIEKISSIIATFLFSQIILGCSNQAEKSLTKGRFNLVADIQTICTQVPLKYVYYESRAGHWDETCKRAKEEASSLSVDTGPLAVFERMIDDLYDPHIALNSNNQKSPRLVPSGSDLSFELIDKNYIVTAVRPLSGAAVAGLKIGDELIEFNGMTPNNLALTRIHSGRNTVSPNRTTWAINAAIAGRRTQPRNIKIRRGDTVLSFAMEAPDVSLSIEPITSKTISGQVGYIRFNNSLGNSETVPAFNAALETLRHTKGLILDLRETAGGGGTDIAEPILGRFIDKKMAYQRTVFRNGSSDNREITPTGSWTYQEPVIVLVGRWTGSMGEGMAIGIDGMKRGNVIGSQMARLAGGTEPIKLKETGMSVWLPTYDLHHIDGTPRHEWKPSKISIADNGDEKDILLAKAILELIE